MEAAEAGDVGTLLRADPGSSPRLNLPLEHYINPATGQLYAELQDWPGALAGVCKFINEWHKDIGSVKAMRARALELGCRMDA